MDLLHYTMLRNYIRYRQQLIYYTRDQQRRLKNQSKVFQVKEGLLYKKSLKNSSSLIKVLQVHELEPILAQVHDHPFGAYLEKDIIFNKLHDYYYWPQIYNDIR